MKHYTVEHVGFWKLDYKVTVFDADGNEEYNALVSNCNIEGYCQCLADMNYKYFVNGINHEQFI